MKKPLLIAIVAVAALSMAAGAWLAQDRSESPTTLSATVLPEPRPLPEFRLSDATGAQFGPSQLRGGWTLMFFGFTNCPDICPNTMGLMKRVKAELGPSRPFRFVFVSVDPQRDTPDKLGAYVQYFDADFVGVTGSSVELEKLSKALYVPYSVSPAADGGQYNVDHAAALVLINPDAATVAYFSPPHRFAEIVTDLRSLVRS
jgi:protein SCO1